MNVHLLTREEPEADKPARATAVAASAPSLSIAVVLPCFNEALTIGRVVQDFAGALPGAVVYVFDNASTDETAAAARRAGAVVLAEPRRGKGNVVRRMFAEVEADVYVMADGDGTYDACAAPTLVAKLIDQRLDMVVGVREGVTKDAGRRGHGFGNGLFNLLYAAVFGRDFTDIFSGYRVLSRRFVKSFPAISAGFETETELSVHASQLKLPVAEVRVPYGRRVEGSASKLSTFRDGLRILRTFAFLLKETRPFIFYSFFSAALAALSLALTLPLLLTYLETGLVPRFPTAILATGLMIVSVLLFVCGLILDSLAFSRVEQKRMLYLAQRPFGLGGLRP
jgi:glycosyltransferase involved in cell wall biosynthesis